MPCSFLYSVRQTRCRGRCIFALETARWCTGQNVSRETFLLPADFVCMAGFKMDFRDLLQNLYQSFMKYVIISKIFVFIDDTFLQEVSFK